MAIKFLNTVQVDTDVLYVDAVNDRVGIGTASPAAAAKLTVMGNQTFGLPGNGTNNQSRWLSIEGNADGSGEGSSRIFFTEHNSSTGAMDNYGMSLGYRGGSTSIVGASGNTWTGLASIGNGEWGMWGHNNNAAGALVMSGDRAATYVSFSNHLVKDISDLYVAGNIYHTGDTNNYISFGTDVQSFVTNGSSRIYITSTGNVGIGTTSPSHKLEVGLTAGVPLASQPAIPLMISNDGQSVDGRVLLQVKHGVVNTAAAIAAGYQMTAAAVTSGTASYYDSLIFLESAGSGSETVHSAPKNIEFYTNNSAGAAGSGTSYQDLGNLALELQADGDAIFYDNVGIGTTSPGAKLDVAGDVYINSNYPSNAAANDLTIGKTTTGDHGLTIVTGASNTASIFFADNNNNDAGRIKYQHSNNSMRFETNRSERMRITSAGNVGIGTTSPGTELHVIGNLRAGASTDYVELTTSGNVVFSDGTSAILPITSGTQTLSIGAGLGASSWNTISHQFSNEAVWNPGILGAADAMSLSSTGYLTIKGGLTVTGDDAQFNHNIVLEGSVFHKDDTNTSFGFPIDDTIAFTTSGTERMRINLGGSVGIGTTTPSYKLHVVGDNDAGIIAERDTSGTEGQIFMLAANTTNVIASKGSGNNPKQLNFNMGIAAKMSIDTSGRVGVGTQAPTTTLDVRGSLRADSVQLFSGSTQYLSVGAYSGAPWINTGSSGGLINFGAPSSNTTNVYVQGTVEARDGLLGFVPTFVHGGFYHSSSSSSSAIYWIPSNYISETTSTQYYNRFVAPYPGRVKKVIMRWTNGATPTATSVTFRKTQNGGVSSTQYAATVTGGATTSMVATKEFSNTDFTFNAGDKYGIGFMTNGGTRFLYGMTYTLVIEYNI